MRLRRELAERYRESGRLEALATLLEQLATDAEPWPRRRYCVTAWPSFARANWTISEGARRWYEATLEVDPGHRPALRALEKLYGRLGDWEALVGRLQGRSPRGGGSAAQGYGPRPRGGPTGASTRR